MITSVIGYLWAALVGCFVISRATRDCDFCNCQSLIQAQQELLQTKFHTPETNCRRRCVFCGIPSGRELFCLFHARIIGPQVMAEIRDSDVDHSIRLQLAVVSDLRRFSNNAAKN